MFDLISFGSLVVDLYFKADDYISGDGKFFLSTNQRKDAEYFVKSIGGGAVNVAIGAQRLGLTTGLVSVMGNNTFTSSVKKTLNTLKIDYSLSEFIDDYYNVSVVLTTQIGERSIINYRSPFKTRYQNAEEMEKLFDTQILFMANLPNLDVSVRSEILEKAKQRNVVTIVNIGISDCQKPLVEFDTVLNNSDVLILNKFEFAALAKIDEKKIDFIKNVKNTYLPQVQLLIVTDAEKGSYAYTTKEIFIEPAKMVKTVRDSNGAGDAYTAGFISEYIKNSDISASMKKGASYAAEIVSKVGAN